MRGIALITAGLMAAATLSNTAQAQNYDDGYYDVARVVRVDPVFETVSEPVSTQQCWREPVTYRTRGHYVDRHDKTPVVLGGIIGGLIGNQFGRGHGRDAATVAGVALGAAIARDEQRRHDGYYQPSRVVRRSEQRCAVQTDYREERRLSGYDVTYDYQGRTGHVFTDFEPGDTIRVRVAVQAIP